MITLDIKLEYRDGTDYRQLAFQKDIDPDQVRNVLSCLRTIAAICPVEFRVMAWIGEREI